ncbi:MAG: hypothetical protein AAF907_12005, partial [Planctomycetota bacterium]
MRVRTAWRLAATLLASPHANKRLSAGRADRSPTDRTTGFRCPADGQRPPQRVHADQIEPVPEQEALRWRNFEETPHRARPSKVAAALVLRDDAERFFP